MHIRRNSLNPALQAVAVRGTLHTVEENRGTASLHVHDARRTRKAICKFASSLARATSKNTPRDARPPSLRCATATGGSVCGSGRRRLSAARRVVPHAATASRSARGPRRPHPRPQPARSTTSSFARFHWCLGRIVDFEGRDVGKRKATSRKKRPQSGLRGVYVNGKLERRR